MIDLSITAPQIRYRYDQQGAALLVVLLMLLAIAGICSSLIWLMNQQQTFVGHRARRASATALAEAGVHRALAILEGASPSGTAPVGADAGRLWRPAEYQETTQNGPLPGRFSLSITDDPDGAVLITSAAEVAGATKRLRARTYLASPALLVALYGTGTVHFQRPPTVTYIGHYGLGPSDRPWIHIAAGREVWFAQADVVITDDAGQAEVKSGPADPAQNTARPSGRASAKPIRIVLATGGDFTVGGRHLRVGVQPLRVMGLQTPGVELRAKALPPMPEVHAAHFQRLAAANRSNAVLNASAGTHAGNSDLRRKVDSLYSPEEFDQLQAYLGGLSSSPRLQGVVFVTGAILIAEGQQLRISDGSLIAQGAVYISPDALLEITHSPASRTLPGLMALDQGVVVVSGRARVRLHGLLYAGRSVVVDDAAHVDVVGAVLAGDPGLSFRNSGGRVFIRYDPAVLGTPGLRVPAGAQVLGWVAGWEELP
jgi:hypothetical protein